MKRLQILALRLPALPLAALFLLLLLLLAGAAPARADTPIALWKTFDGRVNFTGVQATLRSASNGSGNPCTIVASSTVRSANLSLPANAVVVSAQLYWAGSGIPDNTVTFQDNEITATRKFTSSSIGNGFDYFGGAADVTHLVTGGGTYNFSGLTVANGAPWCASQGVLGGFSLLVVYKLWSEPLRVLNIYEGFQHLRSSGVVIDANNFRWDRTGAPTEEMARIGHITWEGDPTLAQGGENLTFEGKALTDTNNTEGNQFNSFSNVNNDKASYGIDFDVYDTTVTISPFRDAVVTTRYSTGQDMVLLNAEILLVPTKQISDLAIKISRAGALKINTDVEYTVTVTNNGPVTEAGTITVTNTLPPGMYYTYGVVTGWSCTATATAGTCTYTRGLAPGATAPVLTVRARVSSLGEKTNTVVVKGPTTDDIQANNTASDTGTATNADGTTGTPPATPPSYIFTDSECKADIAIGAVGQTCKAYTAPTVGGKPTPIWLTATTSNGVPSPASGNDETSASIQFMLECTNPAAGTVRATYAGATLPVCAPQGQLATWSDAVKIRFPAKTVSVEQTFVYNDIGKIRLNLKESDVTAGTEVFTSAPLRIAFRRISNGTHDNPGNKTGAGAGFAQAGAPLTVDVGALLFDDKTFAPNFGNETSPRPVVGLRQSQAVALEDQGKLVILERAPWGNGTSSIKAAWSEAGAVNFGVGLANPDLTDEQPDDTVLPNLYFGIKVLGSTVTVGRFYPAYFKTDASGPFDCPKNLPQAFACLRTEKGAVYSGQPFGVTVFAYSATNERLKNFTGEWFKSITLSAADSAGGAALPTRLMAPGAVASTTIAGSTDVRDPATGNKIGTTIQARTAYQLATGYNNATPRATGITAPATIFVRAVANETTLAGAALITSQRSGVVSDEDPILVLNGRLAVPNALGTDILRTPLKLRAEYWAGAGSGWLLNASYADSPGADATRANFRGCTRKLSVSDSVTDTPCNTSVGVSIRGADSLVRMSEGSGVLWLRPPGKLALGVTRSGSITLQYDGWDWLPSTIGRVNFGNPRSPVIYVREMYF